VIRRSRINPDGAERCPLAGYVLAMSNAFGFVLDDASLRRTAVEGVPETVTALFICSMSGASRTLRRSLRRVSCIRLVGRCPSCYRPERSMPFKSKRNASRRERAGDNHLSSDFSFSGGDKRGAPSLSCEDRRLSSAITSSTGFLFSRTTTGFLFSRTTDVWGMIRTAFANALTISARAM
jgi:hypothetical protein